MILAGYETTANLLAYAVHSLAQDPGRAAKLCAEIDARPARPTFQSLQDMPYLDAVCHETLRLYPTGGPARRIAGKDMLLGGETHGLRLPLVTTCLGFRVEGLGFMVQ